MRTTEQRYIVRLSDPIGAPMYWAFGSLLPEGYGGYPVLDRAQAARMRAPMARALAAAIRVEGKAPGRVTVVRAVH